ncbi:MAG TPA: hypothetical protein VLC95_01100 [Anaerolineae bacterium]|nr:hypothetical protein [Anaerolineae bacterium]
MATTEERMQILNMVASGNITAEEGAKLLAALEPEGKRRQMLAGPGGPTPARWFRVRVTDLETGKNKVNVNLPMSLVDVGTRMGARFAPELEGMDFEDIIEQIKSGAQGKIIEVEDAEGGERVEIYVE